MPRATAINTLAVSRRPGRPKGFDSTCRDKLLAVALSSFARHGFDGVSLRTIASTAGFDVSMLAHHFGSKADLWRTVVDEVAQKHQTLQLELNELKSADQPLVRRVTSLLDRMVDHLADQPETILFITREISAPSERLDYLVEHLIRPGSEICVPLWREAMDAGLLRPSNPVVLHVGLFSGVAMILSSRHIIARLGGGDVGIEQLKTEIHASLLGNVTADCPCSSSLPPSGKL
ncbi:TetR/AcrR family transcriptional regulator [Ferribacterium limneticum]|uniref:TetR/AcrR family transcriptional regulator n=1 Tax=Ferribacterium limneticum TaxID=76259 RepID=UPI001CFAF228|nr:TetR/AcrR family transcriptional regulator [Ferribacterium limneticum]UCV17735.1 TetR/AcrR family transcriptional regulator [Ferribacterium limneticum]